MKHENYQSYHTNWIIWRKKLITEPAATQVFIMDDRLKKGVQCVSEEDSATRASQILSLYCPWWMETSDAHTNLTNELTGTLFLLNHWCSFIKRTLLLVASIDDVIREWWRNSRVLIKWTHFYVLTLWCLFTHILCLWRARDWTACYSDFATTFSHRNLPHTLTHFPKLVLLHYFNIKIIWLCYFTFE